MSQVPHCGRGIPTVEGEKTQWTLGVGLKMKINPNLWFPHIGCKQQYVHVWSVCPCRSMLTIPWKGIEEQRPRSNEHTSLPDPLSACHSLLKNWGSWEQWQISGLGQEKYEKNLDHRVASRMREVLRKIIKTYVNRFPIVKSREISAKR
jgi:hypothetical protein